MGVTLKQPMAQKYCLACQGCCRFQDAQSPWRPKIYEGESRIFSCNDLPSDLKDASDRLKTVFAHDAHQCLALDAKTSKCKYYHDRPLECRLYPFVLMNKKEGIFLAVHLACPFAQEAQGSGEFKDHCEGLKGFFRQESVQQFLRAQKDNIRSGHIKAEEVAILFPILP